MMPKERDMYLYLIAHNVKEIKTHTYIGCVEHFYMRLQQHNGIRSGGPRITKRAAGSWEPLIVLKLPKERKLNSKKLKNEWKQSSRGLESRVKKGFALARKYNLTCYVTETNKNGVNALNILKNKWKDGKAHVTDADWDRLVCND